MQPPRPPQPAPATVAAGSPAVLRRIAVSDLMAGADQVVLLHDGQEYRLRLTRANKLILTK